MLVSRKCVKVLFEVNELFNKRNIGVEIVLLFGIFVYLVHILARFAEYCVECLDQMCMRRDNVVHLAEQRGDHVGVHSDSMAAMNHFTRLPITLATISPE